MNNICQRSFSFEGWRGRGVLSWQWLQRLLHVHLRIQINGDHHIVGVMISVLASNAGRVKLKSIQFIFAASPLSTQH